MRTTRWLAAIAVLAPAAAGGEAPLLWAGHQVVHGEIHLPVLGRVPTRTESYVLARVVPVGGGYRFEQIACRVDMARVLGSQARLSPGAVQRLPATVFSLVEQNGQLVAPPWNAGWGGEDIEGDGNPGITVEVDAPLCGGELYVSAHSRSMARGTRAGDAVRGELRVQSTQQVLGTSGGCLGVFAGDTHEELRGTFAYVPVPAGSTCDGLLRSWPVTTESP
jgi:hypothetical protein